jgi:hypothetical protein
MSDFLTRLAARSLHRTEAIRPRLASLFEPVQTAGVSIPGAGGNAVETTVVSERPAPQPAGQPANAPEAATPARVGVTDRATHIEQAPPGAALLIATSPPLSTREASVATPAGEDVPEGMARPRDPRAADESRDARALAGEPAPEGNVPTTPLAAPIAATAADPVSVEQHLLIAVRRPAEVDLPKFAVAARLDRESSKTPHSHTSSTPPPEPSVHVTIGRIEVRATREPSRPVRDPAASRTTPLEDYLRERSRRGNP